MVNIPYSAMMSTLTKDPQERTTLSAFRNLGMLVGVVIVSVATEPIVGLFFTPVKGYGSVGIIYGLLSMVFFLLCFKGTSRIARSYTEVAEKHSIKQIFSLAKNNIQMLIIVCSLFFSSSASVIRETSAIYYVTYNLNRQELLPLFLGLVVLAMVVGNICLP